MYWDLLSVRSTLSSHFGPARMLRTLIEKLKKPRTSILVAQLNARLQPVHRGEPFEDPLNEALDRAALGQTKRWCNLN
jgi:hypothetical protein